MRHRFPNGHLSVVLASWAFIPAATPVDVQATSEASPQLNGDRHAATQPSQVFSAQPAPGAAERAAASAVAAGGRGSVSPEQLPAVSRLGAETTSYVYRMGWEELRQRLHGTTALKVIEDPQVQAFFNEFWRLTQRAGEDARLYELLLTALHEELVLAGTVHEPALGAQNAEVAEALEELEEKGINSLEVGIVTPAASGRARFAKLVQAAADAWRSTEVPPATGAAAWVGLGPKDSGPFFAWTGEEAYWANSRIAARWVDNDKPTRTLGDSEFFHRTIDPLLRGRRNGPIALYYYDLRPTWERYAQNPAAAGWDMMSWRSLDAVAGATFVEDGGFRNRHYWKVGGMRTGLFEHSADARLNEDWLERVPADASGFTTGVFDAFSFCGSLGCLGAWMAGADDGTIAQLPSMLMMVQPMLRTVGNRYLVYRTPGKYGTFPFSGFLPNHNLIAVIELRDAMAFRTQLTGLLGMAGGIFPITTSEVAGHEVLEINLMYFTLYLVPLENELLVAVHPQLLKDALENWRNPGPSIVNTPAFQEARKYVLKDACFLMYFPPGGFARGIYDEYIPQLQQALGTLRGLARMNVFGARDQGLKDPKLAFNPLTFPRGRDIARHVTKATILSARDDGKGVLFDGYAPVLSTAYYWGYVHALTRLSACRGWRGVLPTVELFNWLIVPPVVPLEPPVAEPAAPEGVSPGGRS